jgi:hypothetical protein
LNDAIKAKGYIPIRPDNQPYIVQEFEGGYLLDGAPLNVYIEGRWFDGQQALLEPYWNSGQVPTPTRETLAIGAVTLPPEVAENYEVFKKSQTPLGLGIPTPVLLGAALLGFFLLRR